ATVAAPSTATDRRHTRMLTAAARRTRTAKAPSTPTCMAAVRRTLGAEEPSTRTFMAVRRTAPRELAWHIPRRMARRPIARPFQPAARTTPTIRRSPCRTTRRRVATDAPRLRALSLGWRRGLRSLRLTQRPPTTLERQRL